MDTDKYAKPPPYSRLPGYPPESTLYQSGAPPTMANAGPQYAQPMQPPPYNNQPPMAYAVPVAPVTQVIVVGGCPSCRVGVLEDDYSCCGVLLAILCFPIGILCCLAMKQRRCPQCGAIFG